MTFITVLFSWPSNYWRNCLYWFTDTSPERLQRMLLGYGGSPATVGCAVTHMAVVCSQPKLCHHLVHHRDLPRSPSWAGSSCAAFVTILQQEIRAWLRSPLHRQQMHMQTHKKRHPWLWRVYWGSSCPKLCTRSLAALRVWPSPCLPRYLHQHSLCN